MSGVKVKILKMISLLTAEERLTREGGEKLRNLILDSLKSHAGVELDFEKKPIASISFWDEGIAKLLEQGLTLKDLKSKVHFKNMHSRDLEVIDEVVKNRAALKL